MVAPRGRDGKPAADAASDAKKDKDGADPQRDDQGQGRKPKG
jgi:hypothetical protein